MKIAILGCGPAGMFAAHAAASEFGICSKEDLVIYSKPRKSFMRGAQYLHRAIPGLSGNSFEVEYKLEGTVDGYRTKVYGDTSDVLVSPETLVGTAPAWDIREAYDRAWELYQGHILQVNLLDQGQTFYNNLVDNFDMVISTVPADVICQNDEHKFWSERVWVTDFIKTEGKFESRDNLVICSGDPEDWWYRQSRIHGWENTEFPAKNKPNAPEGHLWYVEKPIRTDCNCHPEIHREGRYGRWQKGVLSHEAFFNTDRKITAQLQGWQA